MSMGKLSKLKDLWSRVIAPRVSAAWSRLRQWAKPATIWASVISAMASTVKITLEAIPLVLSFGPILATIPVLGQVLLPILSYGYMTSGSIVLSVTLLAGWAKYKEIVYRHQLDDLFLENTKLTQCYSQKVSELEAEIRRLQEKHNQDEISSPKVVIYKRESGKKGCAGSSFEATFFKQPKLSCI